MSIAGKHVPACTATSRAQIAAGDIVLDADPIAGDVVAFHLAADPAFDEGEARAGSVVHDPVFRDHMVRRGIDIDADRVSRAGDRVLPEGHVAVAKHESTTDSECTGVVGDRKPGDRRSHAGEYPNANVSGG